MPDDTHPSRRSLLAGGAALALGAAALPIVSRPAAAQAAFGPDGTTVYDAPKDVRNNISSFRMLDWKPYFANTAKGAILVDIDSRVLHFWSEDQSVYKLYPTSVPVSDDLTRKGPTEIIKKVVGPDWRPTASMKERNPDWPDYIGPGPDNPLGTHALWLSWPAYRIHGTHDTRKIGRRSSNGCIGTYNEFIAELYGLTQIGTQVLIV